MDYLAIPLAQRSAGAIDVPASKSATNRALAIAALSSHPVEIVRPLASQDTTVLTRCLRAMGARIEQRERNLLVSGPLRASDDSETLLDAGESGTAARFLMAIGATTPGRYRLTGSARLRERPMAELAEALVSLGASVEFPERRGFLPAVIDGKRLAGGAVRVDASRSSQFLSALLLAALAMEQGLSVEASGEIASAPYVAVTVAALRAFGHSVGEGRFFEIHRGRDPISRYEVPGDYSSAIALLAAIGVAGGEAVLRGLSWPSADADSRALPVLESMGLEIRANARRLRAGRSGTLAPVRVRATDFPDAVPSLAALAAFASGESRFEGIGHLRLKESDRIEAVVALLASAGGEAHAEADALRVRGPIGRVCRGARRLATANDHRIAMAAAILSLGVPGLLIENPGCVAKSYPDFFRDLEAIVQRGS